MTKGKEEKHNGGEAERERLRGVRRKSSEEQRYGGQVQLSSLFVLSQKKREKRSLKEKGSTFVNGGKDISQI